jgi:hypothetical protein
MRVPSSASKRKVHSSSVPHVSDNFTRKERGFCAYFETPKNAAEPRICG